VLINGIVCDLKAVFVRKGASRPHPRQSGHRLGEEGEEKEDNRDTKAN